MIANIIEPIHFKVKNNTNTYFWPLEVVQKACSVWPMGQIVSAKSRDSPGANPKG